MTPELALTVCAVALACWLRPWRMLGHGARHELLPGVVGAAILMPMLWWWPGPALTPLVTLLGTQLALLVVGWPLFMLLAVYLALMGLAAGTSLHSVVLATFWAGVLPATLALGAGALMRRFLGHEPVSFLAGRCFVIPFACTWAAAAGAHAAGDRFSALAAAADAAVILVSLGNASLTLLAVGALLLVRPSLVATWPRTTRAGTAQAAA